MHDKISRWLDGIIAMLVRQVCLKRCEDGTWLIGSGLGRSTWFYCNIGTFKTRDEVELYARFSVSDSVRGQVTAHCLDLRVLLCAMPYRLELSAQAFRLAYEEFWWSGTTTLIDGLRGYDEHAANAARAGLFGQGARQRGQGARQQPRVNLLAELGNSEIVD